MAFPWLAAADTLRQRLPRKYLNKGIAHAGLYEHDEAENSFRKAFVLDSTLVVAELYLITHAKQLRVTSTSSQRNPNYLYTKAEVLLRLGRFAEAQQANEAARQYTEDENLLKSLEERAEKIEARLRERR